MTLEELVTEWNWDFDPYNQQNLNFAVNEMASFLEEQESGYLVQILRPFIEQKIVQDLVLRILKDEEEENGTI